ncbi:hypothetical protein BDV11DRAFT_590 [Aspergillus similis]
MVFLTRDFLRSSPCTNFSSDPSESEADSSLQHIGGFRSWSKRYGSPCLWAIFSVKDGTIAPGAETVESARCNFYLANVLHWTLGIMSPTLFYNIRSRLRSREGRPGRPTTLYYLHSQWYSRGNLRFSHSCGLAPTFLVSGRSSVKDKYCHTSEFHVLYCVSYDCMTFFTIQTSQS